MTKILRDITTDFQTLCHDGESNTPLKIKVLDAIYDVGRIQKIKSGENDYFIIEAVCGNRTV